MPPSRISYPGRQPRRSGPWVCLLRLVTHVALHELTFIVTQVVSKNNSGGIWVGTVFSSLNQILERVTAAVNTLQLHEE